MQWLNSVAELFLINVDSIFYYSLTTYNYKQVFT